MSENNLLDDLDFRGGKLKHRSIAVIVLVFLHFFCLIVAYPLALYMIESIMVTGAIFGLLSLTLLVLGLVMKRYYLLLLSLFGITSVVFVFLFIVLNELSPSEASKPVPVIILFLVLICVLFFLYVLRKEFRLPRKDSDL